MCAAASDTLCEMAWRLCVLDFGLARLRGLRCFLDDSLAPLWKTICELGSKEFQIFIRNYWYFFEIYTTVPNNQSDHKRSVKMHWKIHNGIWKTDKDSLRQRITVYVKQLAERDIPTGYKSSVHFDQAPKIYFRILLRHKKQTKWPESIKEIEILINNTDHNEIGATPIEVDKGINKTAELQIYDGVLVESLRIPRNSKEISKLLPL